MAKIWTVGHSTRSIAGFISLLEENGIQAIADVRIFPGSKRYPQFDKEALAQSLGARGIRYEHFPELGGRRKPKPGSSNVAWRNDAFRGYADYMETEPFRRGVERLLHLVNDAGPVAIMCAEAVWWRCHRALISDFLKAHGTVVEHIAGSHQVRSHPFTSAAHLIGGELSYGSQSG